MKLHRLLWLPLLLAFPAVSSAWQGSPPPTTNPCLPFAPANTIPWPQASEYGSSASFGRTVIGQFSSISATDRDAVILADGVAVHSRATAAYKLILPITFPTQPGLTDVADVAVLPGGGPGGTDRLLATDSRGLLKTVYQPSGSFDPPAGGFADPVVIENSTWGNAGPIHVVDANGLGGLDVIGVAASGFAVLTLIDSGGGFTPGVISVPRLVLDVVLSNWDSDVEPELVVLTVGGLFIYTLTGTLDNVVPYNANTGAIDRVTWPVGETGTAEFIAWGRPKTSGGGELVVLNRNVNEGAITLSLNSCQPLSFVPKAIVAGRYDMNPEGPDADPYEDLLLVHEVDRTAVVLVNKHEGPQHFSLHPDWHDVVPYDTNSLAPGGVGIPAFDQIDGVGSEDFAFPVRASGKFQVFLNTNLYRFPGDPQGGQPPTSNDVVDDQSLYEPDADPTEDREELFLAIHVPSQFTSYTHVQVVIWMESPPIAGVSEEVDRRRYPLDHSSSFQYAKVFDHEEFPAGSVWSPIETRPYIYAEIRFVNGGSLSPRYFAGLTLQDSATPDYQHLLYQGTPPLLYLEEPAVPPGDSGTILGAYIPMSSQPAFANGQQPAQTELMTGPTTFPYTND